MDMRKFIIKIISEPFIQKLIGLFIFPKMNRRCNVFRLHMECRCHRFAHFLCNPQSDTGKRKGHHKMHHVRPCNRLFQYAAVRFCKHHALTSDNRIRNRQKMDLRHRIFASRRLSRRCNPNLVAIRRQRLGKPTRTDRCSVISLIELVNYQQDFHIVLHSADFSKACPLTFFCSFHSFLRTLFAHAEFVSSARRHKSRD